MKRVTLIIFSFALVASLFIVTPGNSGPESFTIKFATVAPEGSSWMNVWSELNRSVMKKSGGRLKFQIYSGGVSGDEKDVIRKMRLGMLHSAGFTGNGLGEILPDTRVLELPFLFKTSEEVDYVVNKMNGYFSAAFEKKGFILLGWADVGFVNIYTNAPVKSMSDLKKIKMWTWEGDPLAAATFESIGITPIPLSVTDVLTSLQTGMVDGVYSSSLAMVALQWFTKVKYMSMPPMTNATGAVLITKRMFNKLPADLQKILKEESRIYLRKLVETSRKDNELSIDVLKNSGIKVVSVSDSEIQQLEKISETVSTKLTGELFSKDVLNKTVEALNEFRNGQ